MLLGLSYVLLCNTRQRSFWSYVELDSMIYSACHNSLRRLNRFFRLDYLQSLYAIDEFVQVR